MLKAGVSLAVVALCQNVISTASCFLSSAYCHRNWCGAIEWKRSSQTYKRSRSLVHVPKGRTKCWNLNFGAEVSKTNDDSDPTSTHDVKKMESHSRIKSKKTASSALQQSAESQAQRENGRFVPEYLQQNDSGIKGIGGQGGVVYDVNKIKRNLVQEAVKAYKTELLCLLATPSLEMLLQEQKESEEKDRITDLLPSTTAFLRSGNQPTLEMVIEEKLAALVRNNPVSTTTDSNLLEGSWEIAYIAPNASKVLSWKPSIFSDRTVVRNGDFDQTSSKQDGLHVSGQSIGPFQSISRTFHLENLDENETAYVVDCKRRLGRFFMVSERTYEVTRLTRTRLELTLRRTARRILSSLLQLEREWEETERERDVSTEDYISLDCMEGGNSELSASSNLKTSNNQKVEEPMILEVQILYLDSDLCVCVENSNEVKRRNSFNSEKEGNKFDGKLVVYTKSKIWTGRNERFNRTKRILAAFPKFLQSLRSPFNLRGRFVSFARKLFIVSDAEAEKGGFFYHKRSDTSSVRVLRLGESEDEDEELSWEGDEDPFVELDAVTRQEKMKLLSIAEIKETARAHKRLRRKNIQQGRQKRKKLKRPPTEDTK